MSRLAKLPQNILWIPAMQQNKCLPQNGVGLEHPVHIRIISLSKMEIGLFIMISFYYIIRIFLFINLDTNYFVSTPLRRGSSLNSNQRKLFNCPSHWPWIQPGQRGAYQGKSIMSPEVSCLLRSSQRHLKSCWINFICRTCLIICHQGSADESYTYDIQHS